MDDKDDKEIKDAFYAALSMFVKKRIDDGMTRREIMIKVNNELVRKLKPIEEASEFMSWIMSAWLHVRILKFIRDYFFIDFYSCIEDDYAEVLEKRRKRDERNQTRS